MGGAVSDVVSSIGDIGQGAIDIVSDVGASIDDTVNEVIPGGWTTAALLTAGYYYAPEIGAYINASGSTVPVSAVADAGAAVAADNAYLASQALTPAQAATAAAGSVEASQLAGITNGTGSSLPSIVGSSGGNMNLSDFSSALNIASSVNSLTGGGVSNLLGGPGSVSGSEAQQMADPFAPYRSNLAQMYSGALQPGTTMDVTRMPGYSQYTSGVLNPAMEASKRSAGASGMLYSGREAAALQDIGQRGYYSFMTDYLNRLAQGSGAVVNPAQAAGLGLSQTTANQQAFSQGLGGLGQGIAGLFGSNPNSNYIGGSNMSNLFTGPSNYSGGEGGYA